MGTEVGSKHEWVANLKQHNLQSRNATTYFVYYLFVLIHGFRYWAVDTPGIFRSGNKMTYGVVCTFDLKNASSTDYENACPDLKAMGLIRE